jgi:hypothetical protein
LYIAPRQSAKTTILIYEQQKDPKNTAVVLINRQSIERFKNDGFDISNFVGMHDLEKSFRGYQFKRILIDEYFHMPAKEVEALTNFAKVNGTEIIAFGTPKTQYDAELIGIVCHLRKMLAHESIVPYLTKSVNYDELSRDFNINVTEIKDLFVSLLTAPDTQIIHNKWFKSRKTRSELPYYSQEAFELEMEAKYLK